MSKKKNIPELEAEKTAAEQKIEQPKHRNERLDNRIRYLNNGNRSKRTHRLCSRMGYIEHCTPELQTLMESFCPSDAEIHPFGLLSFSPRIPYP